MRCESCDARLDPEAVAYLREARGLVAAIRRGDSVHMTQHRASMIRMEYDMIENRAVDAKQNGVIS